jgi:multidrug efflux pump subunit AcrB
MLLENIVRHHRMGKSAAQAAYDGSMEILPAATAATFAVVAVFLPVVFMDGVIGKFFFQFGVTMSAAVLLSLVEAVTITPMRCATFMGSEKTNKFENFLEKLFAKLDSYYAQILEKILRFPKTVVFTSIGIFILSMFLIKGVRQEFVPPQDQDMIIVNGQTPPGTALNSTLEKAKQVEDTIKSNPNVVSYFNSIGAGGPASEVNQFFMPVNLKPREERKQTHMQIINDLRKELSEVKGVKVSMRDNSSRGLTSGRQFPISFNISGPSLDILMTKGQEIMKKLNEEGLTVDLDTDFKQGLPEYLAQPDRAALALRGVSIESIASTMGSTVAGVIQGQFTTEGKRYDIRIKLPDDLVKSPEGLENVYVRNSFGNTVPLSQLVKFKEQKTYQSISRVNRQRSIGIFGNIKSGQSQAKVVARAEELSRELLPSGYGFSLEGSSAGLTDSFKSLTVSLLMGILVAYMILAIQFNSFVHPISILMALPFSVTGALLILWATNTSLNLFSFIGIIVLMGIAKKNSILLVEFTNHTRKQGAASIKEALIKACPMRLRPILMTSVATVAAATPLIIGNSMGQETRTSMGLTIVGGTIVSTVLTLFVVPCIYLMLSKFESKKKVDIDI